MSFKSDGRSVGAGLRRWLSVRMIVKIAAVLVADFVLLRIWAPDLVNLHADWALGLALLCLLAALIATAWLAWDIRGALRLSRTATPRSISSPRTKQENP